MQQRERVNRNSISTVDSIDIVLISPFFVHFCSTFSGSNSTSKNIREDTEGLSTYSILIALLYVKVTEKAFLVILSTFTFLAYGLVENNF